MKPINGLQSGSKLSAYVFHTGDWNAPSFVTLEYTVSETTSYFTYAETTSVHQHFSWDDLHDTPEACLKAHIRHLKDRAASLYEQARILEGKPEPKPRAKVKPDPRIKLADQALAAISKLSEASGILVEA